MGDYWTGKRYITGKQLREAKKCLTYRQLQVLWMTAQGMTQARIGEYLGISQPAVHYRLARAREKMREKLL